MFEGIAPGWYAVEEDNPQGYLSTTADSVDVEVLSGIVSEVYFGDRGAFYVTLPVVVGSSMGR